MRLTAILTAALSSATLASAIVRRGVADAPDAIDCAYLITFPAGVDTEAALAKHFAATGTQYFIRATNNNEFGNFASFQIVGECSLTNHIETIQGATYYSIVREMSRPAPMVAAPAETQPNQELIHSITGVNDARSKLNLTGKGIKVAVVDSGVYYKHPALGGCIGPNCKVIGGYDFVGDAYTGSAGAPQPDNDPIDNCSDVSHGTHVAGIIAADARNITDAGFVPTFAFTGVAPEASILAYRVFGCTGSVGNDIITAALYRAAADGANVINLSLGGGPSYNDDPQDIAAEVIAKKGVMVIASAGNSGAAGIQTTGNPGNSKGAISVASFDNVVAPYASITVDGAPFIYGLGSNAKFVPGQVLDVLVNNLDAEDQDIQDDGIGAPKVNAAGKALLIRWGDTSKGGSAARCGYAFKAGAVACILYSNNWAMASIAGSPDIPSMFISNDGGKAIIAAFKAGKVPKVIFTTDQYMSVLPTKATVSDFSSIGIDNELFLKPDIGGIGGQVLSTLSPFASAKSGYSSPYGVMSGTSMAAPYVAGCTALFLQAKGKISFEEARAYLQNTADPKNIFMKNSTHSPSYQGSGLINVYDAVTSDTLVLPSKIELKDSDKFASEGDFTIYNNKDAPITYYISNKVASTVNPYVLGDDFTADAKTMVLNDDVYVSFQFSQETVTVPAKSSVKITYKATLLKSADGLWPIFGGYIKVSQRQDLDITIPYVGVSGSYKNRPIWVKKSPSLAARWGAQYGLTAKNLASGLYKDFSFNKLTENSIVNGTAGVPALAVPATTSKSAVIEVLYQGADSSILTAAGFNVSEPIIVRFIDIAAKAARPGVWTPLQRVTYAAAQSVKAPSLLGFTGRAYNALGYSAALPAGPYKMKFSALKNLVDGTSPSDYDTILTPTFYLVYDVLPPIPTASSSSSTASSIAPSTSSVVASSSTTSAAASSSSAAASSSTAAASSSTAAASSSSAAASSSTAAASSSSAAASSSSAAASSSSAAASSSSAAASSATSASVATSATSASAASSATGASAATSATGASPASSATGASAASSATGASAASSATGAPAEPSKSTAYVPVTNGGYQVTSQPVPPASVKPSNLYKAGAISRGVSVVAAAFVAVFAF
ncbi:hypothetical protein CcCBS67573_g02954 [Chytriomyces confervae]|uniref:Peptidase S8/S53 domain-containing protein n=1 Tax=Chytriomyces confervae TaxID=246404 RepID=A0A507FK45_9FUNG|nr:hypothetical protein HDU80_007742 [Chytriomyces hyalinus]TPX75788.1 hypothetical protein CcCBS67573_g02954 [Chytriomyces confervae]